MKFILPKQGITRNFLVLLSGGAIAQALPALFSPVISRLYLPVDFAEFSFWSNLANTVAVAATLRYELAIVLPKEDSSAKQILKGGVVISFGISLLAFFFTWSMVGKFHHTTIDPIFFSFLIAFYVLMVGINQSISYWLIRKQLFKKSSFNRVVQSISIVFLTLLFGFYTISNGLVYAYAIGAFCLCLFSLWQVRDTDFGFKNFNWNLVKKELSDYKQFPLFNTLPSLLNSLSSALPVFFIVKYFSGNESGQYAFVRQYVLVPLMFLAGLISQVYFADVAEKIKHNKPIRKNLFQLIKVLAVISLLIILILVPFGKLIFGFVFGSKWVVAGNIAGIMIFSIALQFIVSPLSITLTALNKIKILSFWQLGYCGLMCCISFFTYLPFAQFLFLLVSIDLFAYLIYLSLIILAVKNYQRKIQ